VDDKKNELLGNLEETSKAFNEALDMIRTEQEEYWNGLTKDQQLMAFCAVSRRIHEGEIKDHRSYRGVLYDTFEFGPEAYVPAQDAGYIDIHNAIYDSIELRQTLLDFCRTVNIENAEEKVDQYIKEFHY